MNDHTPTASSLTRERIVAAAFVGVHEKGFQATGIGDILAAAGLTKGAFYHHFPSKADLGHALLEGMVRDYLEKWWINPLRNVDDPITGLAGVIRDHMEYDLPEMVRLGCPLTNLMTEMAPVDAGFRERLEELYRLWRKSLARSLRQGQQHGHVCGDVDADRAAAFVIASIQGAFIQAKTTQDPETFQDCMGGLADYLSGLKI